MRKLPYLLLLAFGAGAFTAALAVTGFTSTQKTLAQEPPNVGATAALESSDEGSLSTSAALESEVSGEAQSSASAQGTDVQGGTTAAADATVGAAADVTTQGSAGPALEGDLSGGLEVEEDLNANLDANAAENLGISPELQVAISPMLGDPGFTLPGASLSGATGTMGPVDSRIGVGSTAGLATRSETDIASGLLGDRVAPQVQGSAGAERSISPPSTGDGGLAAPGGEHSGVARFAIVIGFLGLAVACGLRARLTAS